MSIQTVLGDVTERAVSTGWQVAAGGAIAVGVFHDPTLTPVFAAVLSVAKSAAVWFYVRNKGSIDKGIAQAGDIAAELGPIVKDVLTDIVTSAAAQQAAAPAPTPGAVAVTLPAASAPESITTTGGVGGSGAPAPAVHVEPPFLRHPVAK